MPFYRPFNGTVMLEFNLGFNACHASMPDGSTVIMDSLMVRATISYFLKGDTEEVYVTG
jgi:hypothetical protein